MDVMAIAVIVVFGTALGATLLLGLKALIQDIIFVLRNRKSGSVRAGVTSLRDALASRTGALIIAMGIAIGISAMLLAEKYIYVATVLGGGMGLFALRMLGIVSKSNREEASASSPSDAKSIRERAIAEIDDAARTFVRLFPVLVVGTTVFSILYAVLGAELLYLEVAISTLMAAILFALVWRFRR